VQKYLGLTQVTPTDIIIMMDLDRNNFKTDRGLTIALIRTLKNILELLKANPTVIWSGRGYHIIQPIYGNDVILENVKDFEGIPDISTQFLRHMEAHLSLDKSDPQHNSTVSYNNCMLRIPGSVNSKNGEMVSIIQRWDRYRPEINYLLHPLYLRIQSQRILKLLEAQKRPKIQPTNFNGSNNEIHWIEKLLKTPLADHRKYCIWRILTPYLLNKRRLSKQEIISIIGEWLDRCSQLRRLDFNVNQRIREGIEGATEGYLPISLGKLNNENSGLYELLGLNSIIKYSL
jgi:hypothetical protein